MKKLTLTSILAISLICPAYADNENITDENKGCTSNTLTVDSGTAALEADWQANTVHITYYKDGTEIPNIGSEYTQCTYDDTLTLPTAPSKDGYTFAGWTVKSMRFDLSTWNYGSYSARGYSRLNGNAGDNETKYGLTTGSGEWATEFTNGTVKGQALCSSTNGTYATAGTPDETGGSYYCWCKATGYAEHTDGNYSEYSPVASSSWVFYFDFVIAGNCADYCAIHCAERVYDNDDFRLVLFGVSQ